MIKIFAPQVMYPIKQKYIVKLQFFWIFKFRIEACTGPGLALRPVPGPRARRWEVIFPLGRAGKWGMIFSNGPGRHMRGAFSNGPGRAGPAKRELDFLTAGSGYKKKEDE